MNEGINFHIISSYCGLGGSGTVQHHVDWLCKVHDAKYQEIISRGKNPYLNYNYADADFLDALKRNKAQGVREWAAKVGAITYFEGKKKTSLLTGQYIDRPVHELEPPQESNSSFSDLPSEEEDEEKTMMALPAPKRRRREPDEQAAEAPHGQHHTQPGAPEEGGEQQVTKPHHVWRRFPNTETAALKYVLTQMISSSSNTSYVPFSPFDSVQTKAATSLLSTGGGALNPAGFSNLSTTNSGYNFDNPLLLQFRMTSPYNIFRTNGGTVTNGNSQPAWLEFFDTKYQYYHNMETEWEITFYFGYPNNGAGTQANQPQEFGYYIFWRYTNEDLPPTSWTASASSIANSTNTNQTTVTTQAMTNSLGTVNLTPDDYFRMGGWHHKHIMLNSTHFTKTTLKGKYAFGQCKMDIKTISPTDAHSNATTAEGWSLTGATPNFPEDLTIIVVADNAMTTGTSFLTPASFRFESEHLIQFKDLQAGYKFPTPAYAKQNASGATLNTDLVFFNRGAGYT
jgi:hypothetical protein